MVCAAGEPLRYKPHGHIPAAEHYLKIK